MSSHVVIAPDKFKGSLTAPQVAAHVAAGLRRVHPEMHLTALPVADGGAGMAAALGVRLLDSHGRDLPPGGAALRDLDAVDASALADHLRGATVVVASDVDSPLLGRDGAARVFAPQKGADPDQVEILEA